MSNSSARSRSNVEIKHVIIDLTAMDERSQLPPVGANLCEGRNYAPIQEGPQPTANMLAAQLAVDEKIRKSKLQEDFSSIFLQYHRACVQVICTTKEYGKTKGSGILFRVSETRLILVTAAHLIKNNNFKLELVIESFECNDRQLRRNQVDADKVYIKVIPWLPYILKYGTDAAVIFLNDMDSAYVLNKVSEFPRPSCASTESASDTFMSIHYAEDRNKQVSVGCAGSTEGNFLPLRLELHIDGGLGASGAPLFNIEGDVVGILKSSQIFDETRNFIRIEDVFKDDYYSRRDELYDLHIIEKNEGLKSNNRLSKLFQLNRQLDVPNQGPVPNSVRGRIRLLEESQTPQHTHILRAIVFDCLGKGGPHRKTRRWSLLNYVESDHFPAQDAYKQAGESEEKLGNRGENLPAITIPKVIHKKLATTKSKDFRSVQAKHIRLRNTCAAIKANFDDYQKKGLFRPRNYDCADEDFGALLVKYRKGFKKALQLHVELHFINEDQKKDLINHIERLIAYGQHDGEVLEHKDRIAIIHVDDA